jgi:hypothetical protein
MTPVRAGAGSPEIAPPAAVPWYWRVVAWLLEDGVFFMLRLTAVGILIGVTGPLWLRALVVAAALFVLDFAAGWRRAAKRDPLTHDRLPPR